MTNKVWIVWLDVDMLLAVFSDKTSALRYVDNEIKDNDEDPDDYVWTEDYDLGQGLIVRKSCYHISHHDLLAKDDE